MSDDKPRVVKTPLMPSFEDRVAYLTGVAVPDPMSDAFAATEAERAAHPIDSAAWKKVGAWKHREFGEELQLRNGGLPHLSMDLFRSEAEDLYAALGQILGRPQVLPFRLSRWERIRQWWLRAVWKRKHYAELAAAREAFVDEYTRKVWTDR